MNDALKNKPLVIGVTAILVAIIAVFGWLKYSESQRFYMVSGKGGDAYKIDRKTGKTWYVWRGKLEEVEELGDFLLSQELPTYIVSELTGKGGYSYGSTFGGDIYNPSDYHIDSITFFVQNEKDGKERWQREFTSAVSIAPKGTGSFSFDTIDGEKAEATSWGIQSATGRQKNKSN